MRLAPATTRFLTTARKPRSTAAPGRIPWFSRPRVRSISATPTRPAATSTSVANFQNVDASALSSAASITGSSSANTITGGSGNDTIDGAGGADVIAAGAGNDTVTYRGTETSIDGGTGIDTLILAVSGGTTAVNFSVSAGADQTTGDSVAVTNFENLDASALSSALTVTGSSSANTITTGSGNDTIDGGGGADVISAGGGNDTVTYRGTETSIDGGTGTNTLVLAAATTANLGNADQTTGDSTNVTNFQNVDASALSAAISITGTSGANILTGGSANDTIDGAGGADVIFAGGGNDSVAYYGAETSIDGGTGTNTLVLKAVATVNLGNADQTSGDSTTVANFQNVDASALSSAVSITGSSAANTITGGSGNDTIDGAGGADVIAAGGGNNTVTYRGTETSIDGGAGTDTLILAASGGTTAVNLAVAAGSDQTTGDTVSVTNFENIDGSASEFDPDGHWFFFRQHDLDRFRQRYDRRRRRRGRDLRRCRQRHGVVLRYRNFDRRRTWHQHAGAQVGGYH